jgi:hypothetical protein
MKIKFLIGLYIVISIFIVSKIYCEEIGLRDKSLNYFNDKESVLEIYFISKDIFYYSPTTIENIKDRADTHIKINAASYSKELEKMRIIKLNDSSKNQDEIRLLILFYNKESQKYNNLIAIGNLIKINDSYFEYNDELKNIFLKIIKLDKDESLFDKFKTFIGIH